MRIILLSGAIKNAGDYLITERTRKLLEHVYPNAEIIKIVGNYPLDDKMEMVNTADAMVIAGGPSYTKKLYPRDIPLVENLSAIKPKIFILGSGWYGNLTTDAEIFNYKFEDTSKTFLKRVENDSKFLGCRDYYAVKVLKANGFNSGIMTGCPAWFDIPSIGKRYIGSGKIKKILISDPADIRAFGKQSLEIVKYAQIKFPQAQIEYVFHRGTKHDEFTPKMTAAAIDKLIAELKKLGVVYHDIAFGCEGFKLYDDCDLHIGHRVHAHIYNMSIRNRSILIEEDSRGAGVNEAMRLWGIKAYEKKISSNTNLGLKIVNKVVLLTKPNRYVTQMLNTYIDYIQETDNDLFNISYGIIDYYYKKMIDYVESIEKLI